MKNSYKKIKQYIMASGFTLGLALSAGAIPPQEIEDMRRAFHSAQFASYKADFTEKQAVCKISLASQRYANQVTFDAYLDQLFRSAPNAVSALALQSALIDDALMRSLRVAGEMMSPAARSPLT